jgi:hypothetical protein
MPNRPLAVTQKQIVAILKAAQKTGVRLKIKAREGEVVFIADEDDGAPVPPPKKEPSFDL